MLRMAVLRAAPSLDHVPPTKPIRRHPLLGKRSGEFAIDLKHPFRLILEPDHDPIPKKGDGSVDLERSTAIRILRVEDYHR